MSREPDPTGGRPCVTSRIDVRRTGGVWFTFTRLLEVCIVSSSPAQLSAAILMQPEDGLVVL